MKTGEESLIHPSSVAKSFLALAQRRSLRPWDTTHLAIKCSRTNTSEFVFVAFVAP